MSLLLLPPKQCSKGVEVVFQDETETLGVERVLGEIAVVGLVINPHGKVAVREEEIAKVEVADELLIGGGGIVAVAKLTIEEQTVVEHRTVEHTFVLRIVETFVTR